MDSRHTALSLRAPNPEIVAAFLQDGVDMRVRLFGSSMKPLVRAGSILRFSATEPVVGDIVLLRRFPNGATDKLVANRVVAIDDSTVTTKGDSSQAADPPMGRSGVLGTAIELEAAGGRITPLRNPWMRTLTPAQDAIECAN